MGRIFILVHKDYFLSGCGIKFLPLDTSPISIKYRNERVKLIFLIYFPNRALTVEQHAAWFQYLTFSIIMNNL